MNKEKPPKYRAMISSDWNECLSPMGPFDPIIFTYPELKPDLARIFREYTGNRISLSEAVNSLAEMMPAPLTVNQMDAYLDQHFRTYRGVSELIDWCASNAVLFMINTTASVGFFQRVLAKGLLPKFPVLSAHPGIRFESSESHIPEIYELLEISDKAVNTSDVAVRHKVPFKRIVIMGDSGGDGPHFEWGASVGAFLVGSMTKWSLENFCKQRKIQIDYYLGPRYGKQEKRDENREMAVDFRNLIDVLKKILQK